MIKNRDRSYGLNLLLSIDQLISSLFGYNADVSISAMLGEVQWIKYSGQQIPWSNPLKAVLQRALDKTQKHHCLRAYRYEMERRNQTAIVKQINQLINT
jgi:hypothetical protein